MAKDTCLSNVSRLSMRTPRLHTHLEIQNPGRNYLNSDLSDGPRWRLRVLSHLPHLVVLNRTRVGFRSWCGSFGPVRTQQSHSGVHQKRTKQAYRDLVEEVISACFQTNPGAVHPTSNRPNYKKNCAFLG